VGPKASLFFPENRKIFCPACWDANRKLSDHQTIPLGSPTRVNDDSSLTSDPKDSVTQKTNFHNDSPWTAMKMGRASITDTSATIYKSIRCLIPEECKLLQDIWYILQDGNI
jgi:hypothetical protein